MPTSTIANSPNSRRAESAAERCRPYGTASRIFVEWVTLATRLNGGNPLWWYTWLASRDRLNTSLWNRIRNGGAPQSRQIPALRLIRWTAWLFLWILAAKLFRPKLELPPDAGVVFFSVMNTAAVNGSGTYTSAYFGQLPAFLEREGERVVHCGLVEGNPWATTRRLARAHSAQIVTFAHLLGFADLYSALLRACRVYFAAPPGEWSTYMADDFRAARADILQGILIERSTRRLLDRLPSARVIHTYENNPWEHACDFAAHTLGRQTLGYLHCAVLPSHLKNYKADEERDLRPAPDRVICTGPAARDLFLSLGAHDPGRVLAGCALRDADLRTLPQRKEPPERIATIIVLLEGLPSMADALRIIDQSARADPERTFLVRAHPSLPLSPLARAANIRLGNGETGGLQEAPPASLTDALAAADAVIYIGSTAAMTAAYIGVPLIKLVLDEELDDDPLCDAPVRSRRAHTADDVLDTLRAIESMPCEAFQSDLEKLRAYLLAYLAPPTPANMSVFRT